MGEARQNLPRRDGWLPVRRPDAAHLASLAPRPERGLRSAITGSTSSAFRQRRRARMAGDGSDPDNPVILLSVGRVVAKKGYDDLLAALALLPAGLEWRFVHIGGGALATALMRQAERLGLSRRIEWRGALAQPEVLAGYRQADLFVLASKMAGTATAMAYPMS